jgi:hypothetical protein
MEKQQRGCRVLSSLADRKKALEHSRVPHWRNIAFDIHGRSYRSTKLHRSLRSAQRGAASFEAQTRRFPHYDIVSPDGKFPVREYSHCIQMPEP